MSTVKWLDFPFALHRSRLLLFMLLLLGIVVIVIAVVLFIFFIFDCGYIRIHSSGYYMLTSSHGSTCVRLLPSAAPSSTCSHTASV